MFVPKRHLPDRSGVSFYERRDLLARTTNPRHATINRVYVLVGQVDMQALQRALARLASRHDALRTRFTWDGAQFIRHVADTPALTAEYFELSAYEADDEHVRVHLRAIASRGFAVNDYPLARICMLSVANGCTLLCLAMAETITDAGAASVFIKELSDFYIEECGGEKANSPALPYELRDYVASHNAWMHSTDYAHALERRCDALYDRLEASGGIEQLYYRPASSECYLIEKKLPAAVVDQLTHTAALLKISTATILMTASALSIAQAKRVAGTFFTTLFSNRHLPGAASLLGHLATTVAAHQWDEPQVGASLKSMHRELFYAMAQFGMIPIQEIGRQIAARYGDGADLGAIKFGKVVIDVLNDNDIDILGLPTSGYRSAPARAVSNDFKFHFRKDPAGQIGMWLRGVDEAGNRCIAQQVVDALFERNIAAFYADAMAATLQSDLAN